MSTAVSTQGTTFPVREPDSRLALRSVVAGSPAFEMVALEVGHVSDEYPRMVHLDDGQAHELGMALVRAADRIRRERMTT